MNILPLEFKGRGSQKEFQFTQLKRKENIALYKKSDGICHYYETIIVKAHDGLRFGGNTIEPAEFYPGDNQFGNFGWCFCSDQKNKAELKFQELLNLKNNVDKP